MTIHDVNRSAYYRESQCGLSRWPTGDYVIHPTEDDPSTVTCQACIDAQTIACVAAGPQAVERRLRARRAR